MGWAGFGKTEIRYDMFDLERDAMAAKRYTKCENIYHRGQTMAWDGKEVLPMLIKKHGGSINVGEREKEALKQVFAIILWGELAAWKISAQLADRLVPLEAKMAATSQAHDEARHFYTMYDYLKEIDYLPERMDRAPQALLDTVLETDNLVHKMVGMQLMIETIALGIFQAVRERNLEPVLAELMTYYERDEARHVGLGMQYLPELVRGMKPHEVAAMSAFQLRLLVYALWEAKLMEEDFKVLGIKPRKLIEGVRRKQMAAFQEAYEQVGIDVDKQNGAISRALGAAVEVLFPPEGTQPTPMQRAKAAMHMLRVGNMERFSLDEFAVHEGHRIKLARGGYSDGAAHNEQDAAE